jgi:hypothetical protein
VFGETVGRGAGVFGRGRTAGFFDGNVIVTGDIQLAGAGADCAEEFDVAGEAEPGSVMVMESSGCVTLSNEAYDCRVVGVVSGAGGLHPAVVLDRQSTDGGRRPLALVGRVYCKVDARYAPIAVGDTLTTSATPGYAMKAANRDRAFGAILGKALDALPTGRGLVPILVTLQ